MSRPPMLPSVLYKVFFRLRLMLDTARPDKPVWRRIRGVRMRLPRRHALPYLARPGTPYVDNMLELAASLERAEGELSILDIGANVGDSALFLLDRVDATIVCVEPDPIWLDYLDSNVAQLPQVTVERSMILGSQTQRHFSILHTDIGSSGIYEAEDGEALSTKTTDELLAAHPQLQDVRLIKTDTDGYDVMLVPHLAATFVGSRPVIFLEYSHFHTRIATPDLEPSDLWRQLIDLGYTDAVVWDNGGRVIGPASTADLAARSVVLDGPREERDYSFWDVAVAHADDPAGRQALRDAVAATA